MQLPVKITYRGLDKSDKIDNLVLDYASRLEKFCDQIHDAFKTMERQLRHLVEKQRRE